MRAVLDSFGMDLNNILQSCELVKVDTPNVPTVIGMVGGILFSFGAVGSKYMDVATLSGTPESLLLFSIFCGKGF